MEAFMKKLILVFLMVFGLASVVNAECIDANGKKVVDISAKDFMALESEKAKYEKLKKEVEEILQIYGRTKEQAKDYDYVKFLNGLEMLQKSDRCLNGNGGILAEYQDEYNDEYYFSYGSIMKHFRGLDLAYEKFLGKDLSGELGELADKKLEAKQDSYSADIWLGK